MCSEFQFLYIFGILRKSHCDITSNCFENKLYHSFYLCQHVGYVCQALQLKVSKLKVLLFCLAALYTQPKREFIQDSWFHRRHEVPLTLCRFECTTLSLPVPTLSCRSGLAPAPRRNSTTLWWPLMLACSSAV